MAQNTLRGRSRRRLSLSVRLSLLVLFAALAPLAAVVAYNARNAQDALIAQAQQALTTDASSRVAQIDLYLNERLSDSHALAGLITTPGLLACADAQYLPANEAQVITTLLTCTAPLPAFGEQYYGVSNCRGMTVGAQRDTNYTTWALYDAGGHPLLAATAKTNPGGSPDPFVACSTSNLAPLQRDDLGPVLQGKPSISGVYSDSTNKVAYVQIYTPVPTQALVALLPPGAPALSLPPGAPKVLGFIRSTLRLGKVWNIVASDRGANGAGSAAFITDQYGIRIAATDPNVLFTGVRGAQLTQAQQQARQAIARDQRFGQSVPPSFFDLPQVAQSLQANQDQDTFTGVAAPSSSTTYQFVRLNMTASQFANGTDPADPQSLNPFLKQSDLQWSYFVLSPLSTVTAVADNQVRTSLLSAGVIAILAVLIALVVGRGTTRPVRASARELEGAAASLKALAARQQASAGEQHWVVDACKTGLEGVRYLSDAMNQAARRIIDVSNWFGEYWDRLTEDQARRTVQHLQELAHYVDEAARRQQDSSSRLDKAITVTMQVSDQLVAGANAATESADQLEQVVSDLQHVVGGGHSSHSAEAMPSAQSDYYGQGRQDLPPAALPRQIMAPAAVPQPAHAGYSQGGWPSSADPSRSQTGWGEYSQYPQAPYDPYYGANGEYAGGYGGAPGAGQGDNPWGNAGRMPPDGRSHGGW